MSAATIVPKPFEERPTLRRMLTLWVPLAASSVMMVLEPSIVNVGLARTFEPELALAAYGVAYGLALLFEAPILMLIDASVARSTDRANFVLIRRFTVVLGLIVTAAGLLVVLSPLYGLVVGDLMHIPADVAARTRPTLEALCLWSFPVAWRRTHQGILIRARRTTIISVATVVRLVTLASGLACGLTLVPERGALVAGVAMVVSVTVEAALITWAARQVLHSAAFPANAALAGEPHMSLRQMWQFYRPLAITSLLRQLTRPWLSASIAVALMARASLAAWPVVWGFVTFVAGPCWSLQQLTTALVVDRAAYDRVRRFALGLSTGLGLLLGLVVLTPLYGWILGGVYNLTPDLQQLSLPSVAILAAYPLITGIQSLLRGLLIRSGNTAAVRTASIVNIVTLGAALLLGARFLAVTGVTLAAIATQVGAVAELAWLQRETRA
jgi:Na+-driven multidrug efflux pump